MCCYFFKVDLKKYKITIKIVQINWLKNQLALIKLQKIMWFINFFKIIINSKTKAASHAQAVSSKLSTDFFSFQQNQVWTELGFLKQRLDPNPRNNYQTMQHISLDYDFSPNLNHTMRRSRTLKKNTSTQVSKNWKKCIFHSPSST